MTNNEQILQIYISLIDIEPPVWRRILVPADMTLTRFNDVIQVAMSWYGYHLYEFQVGNRRYGVPDPDSLDPDYKIYRDSSIKLDTIVKRGINRFTYTYDFGDNWQHKIVIEQQLPSAANILYPTFVEGGRRCPPEDVGGVCGYFKFLEAILNPAHEDHKRMQEWVGDSYDPEEFDVFRINVGMENIANRRRPGPRKKRP